MKPLFAILLILTFFCSCSDDTPSDTAALYDIVKLESQSSSGAVFTLCKPGSDEEIRLTAAGVNLNADIVAVGDRCLLIYTPADGQAYKSGAVNARGYQRIVNGTLQTVTDSDIAGWDRDPVYLLSAWRMGNYLNMHLRLPFDDNPRKFTLAMSETPADPSCPDLYLIHALQADVATFSRAYYASFDISQLIADPAVTGFTLHVNNSNLNLDTLHFKK